MSEKENNWDIIALTALDDAQKILYEHIINVKLKNNLQNIKIHIIPDNSRSKIGTGIATIKTIYELQKLYGTEKLLASKILLIHAGGWTQRLPQYSLFGKLFMPVPIKIVKEQDFNCNSAMDIFDYKLNIYVSLLPYLFPKDTLNSSGILVTCADDLLTYNLKNIITFSSGSNKNSKTIPYDILCLAHPSSPSVGRNHGVFGIKTTSLDNTFENLFDHDLIFPKSCISCILQKPTLEEMRSRGCIMQINAKKFIFSDSCFIMSPKIVSLIIKLVERHGNNYPTIFDEAGECECYIDFLHPPFWDDTQFLISAKSTLCETDVRDEIHQIFKDKNLVVYALMSSKFYHLGTLPELISNFCQADPGQDHFRTIKQLFPDLHRDVLNSMYVKDAIFDTNSKCPIVITCGPVFIEKCSITTSKTTLTIEPNVILFNINLELTTSSLLSLSIPKNTLWFTVPLELKHLRLPMLDSLPAHPCQVGYVTFCFGVSDDMKVHSEQENINWLNRKLKLDEIEHATELCFDNRFKISLWNLKLFPLARDPTQSFLQTYFMVYDFLNHPQRQTKLSNLIGKNEKRQNSTCGTYFSMSDVSSNKVAINQELIKCTEHLKNEIKTDRNDSMYEEIYNVRVIAHK